MITASTSSRQPDGAASSDSWQWQMSQAVTDPSELLRLLDLDPALLPGMRSGAAAFRLRVPRGFVRRMRRGDPNDPLLLQVLPGARELEPQPGFEGDPLLERAALQAPGLLHKYHARALLITTGACAIHCRYCFRREFPYQQAGAEDRRWQAALAAIAADSSIEELILSGGDPLSLSNARLAQLTQRLRPVPHLRRLRLHTRTPIVLPERIDAGFLGWLAASPWPIVIVLHCNHANEIDDEVRAAAERLRAAGATLLNQSVLLAGINDSLGALEQLSHALWSARVLPYYLHLLDRVRGSAHFEVGESRARALMAQLSARLPGYLVPRLARECAGAPAKTVLASAAWDTLHSPPPTGC